MSLGVLFQPSFTVSQFIPADTRRPRGVVIEMDETQTAILLSRAKARRMAKGLLREAARP